jgi:predicted nucleic acid-binding protein
VAGAALSPCDIAAHFGRIPSCPRRVCQRAADAGLNSVLKVIELRSEIVKPVPFSEPVCSDPDDDKFLEAAIAAGADYIVSGDKALLNVKFHHEVEVVRPSRFLKLLSR